MDASLFLCFIVTAVSRGSREQYMLPAILYPLLLIADI